MSSDNDVFVIPWAANLDRLLQIIQSLYQNKAFEKAVSADDLNKWIGIHPNIISSNLKFLRFMDLISGDSKSSAIKLTLKGNELGKSILFNEDNSQKQILTELVNTKLNDLVQFCNNKLKNNSLDYVSLFNQIQILGQITKLDGNNKKGIETILEILIKSGIVNESYSPENNQDQIKSTSNEKSSSLSAKKIDLPSRASKEWMVRLFQSLNKVKPSKIDKSFITLNVVGAGNEGKILKLVKYLEIANDDGSRGKNYDKLNCYEEENFGINLLEVIKEKYSKIFATGDMQNVNLENLISFVSREYDLDKDISSRVVDVLGNLCVLAGMNIPWIQKQTKPLEKIQNNNGVRSPVITNQRNQPTTNQRNQPTTNQRNQPTTNQIPQFAPHYAIQPTQQNISEEKLGVDIKINIDAKDKDSFQNTIEFLEKIAAISRKNHIDLNVSNQLVDDVAIDSGEKLATIDISEKQEAD